MCRWFDLAIESLCRESSGPREENGARAGRERKEHWAPGEKPSLTRTPGSIPARGGRILTVSCRGRDGRPSSKAGEIIDVRSGVSTK